MNELEGGQVLHPIGYLRADVCELLGRQTPLCGRGLNRDELVLVQELVEVSIHHVLHDNEQVPSLADSKEADYVLAPET